MGRHGRLVGGSMSPDEGVSGASCLQLRVSASELELLSAVSILSAFSRPLAKAAAGSHLSH